MPAEDPARNPFFRFSLKRSLGSGLFSIALEIRQNGDKSTIGAGLTTQLSKLRKRNIFKFFPGALWVPNFLSEANAGSPRWWFGTYKRTPDPRSLPLVKRNSKSKSIIWSNKKSTWALEGGSEGNRKTRNEVTRPKEGLIWVQIEERRRSGLQLQKPTLRSSFTLKRGKSKGEKKRGSLTYINRLHTKGKIDSS